MTRIPNNVIKPPKGYEYVQRRSVPIVQIKRTTQPDDTKVRINYLESKLDKIMDELRVLKRRDKYKPKPNERAKRAQTQLKHKFERRSSLFVPVAQQEKKLS